jgi:hypothetical protein
MVDFDVVVLNIPFLPDNYLAKNMKLSTLYHGVNNCSSAAPITQSI